jgi:hypothetical protein
MSSTQRVKAIFSLLLGIAASGLLTALEVPSADFQDSADIRSGLVNTWLAGDIDPVKLRNSAVYVDRFSYGFKVSQQRDAKADLLAITVSPSDKKGVQGDWVLYRKIADGLPDHIRIYPVFDSSIYIDIRSEGSNPQKGRCLLDLVIYGTYAARNIPLGLSFTSLYTARFESIVALTSSTVDWSLLDPDLRMYGNIASAAAVIRNGLKTLVYLDDGAFDEKGQPVYIKDGMPQESSKVLEAMAKGQNPSEIIGGVNCSGFAKWIVDGIVRPVVGENIHIEPLKAATVVRNSEVAELNRKTRDLNFALDWTRHLASAALSAETRKTIKPDVSGFDVSLEPFSDSCLYVKDIGYRTREILPLLYYLAVKEPGNFYLGAISDEAGVPAMRQYHHIAAFFPSFDADGHFSVAIFESAVETPVSAFFKATDESNINLVRIRIPEAAYFKP